MSIPLISLTQLIPPKENYLKKLLYDELKSQCAWRDKKSDSISDQVKYFESFFSKKIENTYINKDLIQDYLNESEKLHGIQMNEEIKSKHLEIDSQVSQDSQVKENNLDSQILYYLDSNSEMNMNIFSFKLENDELSKECKQLDVLYEDQFEINLDFDTSVRQISIPSSRYFRSSYYQNNSENSQSLSNCILMDMYSIYNLSISFDEEIKLNKFEKLITLSELPNSFLSNTMLDRLFVISNSKINPNRNRLTLMDNEFRIISEINYGEENNPNQNNTWNENIYTGKSADLDGSLLKGEFFSHPQLIILYKQLGKIALTDFRSGNYHEQKINMTNLHKISDLKVLDEFKFMLFSKKSVSLYDLRYPSLAISHFPLNINYLDLEIKNIYNKDQEMVNYLAIDSSRKDNSVLLIDTLAENLSNEEFFQEFLDVKLFDTTKEVCDSCGIVYNDLYLNFSADSFGGLYSTIHTITNATNFTNNSCVTKINSNLRKNSENGKFSEIENFHVSEDKDQIIVNLYEKFQMENHLKKQIIKIDKLKYERKNTNYIVKTDECDLSSDESDELSCPTEEDETLQSEVDFGTSTVNGIKKKMYKIENKRKLVEKLINDKDKVTLTLEKFNNLNLDVKKYSMTRSSTNEINVKQYETDMILDEGKELDECDEHQKLRYFKNLLSQNEEMKSNSSEGESEKDMDWLFDMLEDKSNAGYFSNSK